MNTTEASPSPNGAIRRPAWSPLILWKDGVWVFGRFLWFISFWALLMLPMKLIHWLLNPADRGVFANGEVSWKVALEITIAILYTPISLAIASRWSGQFRETKYPHPESRFD